MSKSVHDLHDVLDGLRGQQALLEVNRPVERSWEVAAVLDRLEYSGRFDPVLFRSVLGHPAWSILGNLFADRNTIASFLGIGASQLSAEFTRRLKHPIPAVMVDDGPVQAHLIAGDAGLDAVPLPTLHERDAAPYISLGVAICRDPDTGVQNVGVYRFMQRGPRELVPSLTSISNAADIFRRYERRGQPMEMAIVPGASPALSLAASYRAAAGVDEAALAGGSLRNRSGWYAPGPLTWTFQPTPRSSSRRWYSRAGGIPKHRLLICPVLTAGSSRARWLP